MNPDSAFSKNLEIEMLIMVQRMNLKVFVNFCQRQEFFILGENNEELEKKAHFAKKRSSPTNTTIELVLSIRKGVVINNQVVINNHHEKLAFLFDTAQNLFPAAASNLTFSSSLKARLSQPHLRGHFLISPTALSERLNDLAELNKLVILRWNSS